MIAIQLSIALLVIIAMARFVIPMIYSSIELKLNGPRFTHDCNECVWLGRCEEYDLYFCDKQGYTTFIARWSDEGSHYHSHPLFIIDRSELMPILEAYSRYLTHIENLKNRI